MAVSNKILTSDVITKEALMRIENELVFAESITNGYSPLFANSGNQFGKIGDTLHIRKPPYSMIREGKVFKPTAIEEDKLDLKLTEEFGSDTNFDDKELVLNLNSFSESVLEPATSALANSIDIRALRMYKDIPSFVGSPIDSTTLR